MKSGEREKTRACSRSLVRLINFGARRFIAASAAGDASLFYLIKVLCFVLLFIIIAVKG